VKKLPEFGERSLVDEIRRFGREEREEEEENAEEERFGEELRAGLALVRRRSRWKRRRRNTGFGQRGGS